MPSLQFDVTALDRASQAFNRIADRIDFLVARLQALDHTNASPRVDVDTDPADRTLGRWAIDVRRRLREALATIPTDIELRANAGPVEVTLARIRGELADIANERIGIDITGEQAITQIEALKRELKDLDHEGADIEVKADIAAALAALEAVLAEARRVDGTEAEVKVKTDTKGIKDLINAAALFQRSIQQFARPIAAIGAIPGIVSLTSSLVDLLGLLGLVPGLAAAAVAGVAALAVGFNGFGQALKDIGDPKKFAADLKELAPSAQAVAKAFRDLAPAWGKVQDVVQQALFAGLAFQLRQLAGLFPTIQAGLSGVATGINEIVFQWLKWATSIDATQKLGAIFENIRATFQDLGPVVQNVAEALTDMALVGARMLPDFANGLAGLTGEFRDWIAEITANGKFQAWIEKAIATLEQLGRITGNVFSGLGALFDAADASGAGFLDTLEKMTAAFSTFANSAEGQQGITAFFTTIRDVINGLVPGLASLGQAILGAFVELGPTLGTAATAISAIVTSFSSALPILGGVAAAIIGPLATAFGALANVLGPVPGFALAAFVVFKTAPVILGAAATAMTFLAGVADTLGLRLLALGEAAAIGGALTGLGSAIGAIGTAFRAVATFLTGPWGIAILAAVAVIGLLTASNDDAADAAAAHEAAEKRLQSTLDQTNGSITEATQKQVALDLAQTKLASTGESLATALQKNGIAFNDFAQAAGGNDTALQKVNAQLIAVAESQAKTGSGFEIASENAKGYGISLEQLTAAALGNTGAFDEIVKAYEKGGIASDQAGDSAQSLVNLYKEGINPALIESAQLLGDQAGALKDAQAVTQLAADATANWGARLRETNGVLQEFSGIIGKNGQWDAAAAGATQLAESFKTLGETAQATARNAAREVTAMGGSIQAAGAAGAASVAQQRAEFLKLLETFNITGAAANELADELGLIPAVTEINIETNADETQQELNLVAARLQALPKGTTTLRVEALTDDAIRRLEALGIKVEKLKDGTFVLHLDDKEFQAKLNAARDSAHGLLKDFIAKLDLDTDDAQAKLNDFKTRGGAGNVAIPISFEHSLADQQLNTLHTNAQQPMVAPLNVDPAQANAGLQAWQAAAQQPVVAPLNADPAGANAVLGAWVGAVTGTVATAQLNADPAQALAALGATVATIIGTTASMTIAALNGPALATLAATVGAVIGSHPQMTITANAGPAISTAKAAVAEISHMSAQITVTTTNINRTINEVSNRAAAGGMAQHFATGGIVPGYAPGKDSVPALLSPGEAVLVPEAVRALGFRAITNLNKLASGGRQQTTLTPSGASGYYSWGMQGGRTTTGTMSQSAGKTYVLNVYNAGNNEIDLREQFRKMEVLGV